MAANHACVRNALPNADGSEVNIFALINHFPNCMMRAFDAAQVYRDPFGRSADATAPLSKLISAIDYVFRG